MIVLAAERARHAADRAPTSELVRSAARWPGCARSRGRRGPADATASVRRIAVERDAVRRDPRRGRTATGSPPRHRTPLRATRAHQSLADVRERMRIESVWLAYGENWVVRDVSLPVRQGEVLALIGASGSGKTTLLRSLNRLTEVTAGAARAGQITLDGEEIHELEVNDLRRRVSMVFQQPNPFPMSIFDNVAYALAEQPDARAPPAQAHAGARAGSGRGAAPGRPLRRGRGRPRAARRCGSPAASSSACASPARSPPSQRCCCSTSRARRSTRSRRRRSRS